MSTGMISSASAPADLNKKSFAGLITRLMPNGGAQLVGLSMLLKTETAVDVTHGYWSKSMIFPAVQLNGAVLAAATTLVCDSTADVVAGDLLQVDSTGEIVLVNTVVSGTDLSVSRGIGTVAAANIADNVVLRSIGNAFEEGSTRPSAVNIVAAYKSNYTQIFRNSWAVTKTAAAIPQVAGAGQVSESKQDCSAFHGLAIEKALFFGQKYMGTKNGQPFHTMEGIIANVTANAPGNITTLGSTTNWTQLEAALDTVLQTVTDPKGGNIRTMFVGGPARRVLHNIARLNSTYQITTAETQWGLQIDIIRTPRGTFEIIEHPLFNAYGISSTWAKMAVIVDLGAFNLAYLRPTSKADYNESGALVDNGIDAQGGTLTTEVTCKIVNPAAFGIIYNFTAAAAG